MITRADNTGLVKNTSYKVVIPFYAYAAVAFLTATILLLFSTTAFTQHHFNPNTLAITHTMALGWGTMIILGASHQLVPVLIEARLYSEKLAYLSFVLTGIGIPLLVYSFFTFRFDVIAHSGTILINAGIIIYLINLALSILKSKNENVHAIFVFTAAAWLLVTTLIGLLLICNFTKSILPEASLHYLSLHAHLGIVGWFLLTIMGVASRLIPMFLISKYDNPKLLWLIYYLVNMALILFAVVFFTNPNEGLYLVPVATIFIAIILFIIFCSRAYKVRIRRHVDEQMKISMLSIIMMILPVIILVLLIVLLMISYANTKLVLAYGFSVFFGWLTTIILGMTFKTLPFIVWNKRYHDKAVSGVTPNPKDLFSAAIFKGMGVCYLSGFVFFAAGILLENIFILKTATVFLLLTAILYNWNIVKMLFYKPVIK